MENKNIIKVGRLYKFDGESVRVLRWANFGRVWLVENPKTKFRYLLFTHQLKN